MASLRATPPAAESPHFPAPVFLSARRVHGLVETPDEVTVSSTATNNGEPSSNPPSLIRHSSVTGNILLLQHPDGGTSKAFLLQRKVGTSPYGGSMRVGFRLEGKKPGGDGLWHVRPKESKQNGTTAVPDPPSYVGSRKRDHDLMMEDLPTRCEMVTVYIENENSLAGSERTLEPSGMDSLKTELAALQYIAQQSTKHALNHLWGSTDMGNDSGWLCTILSPWHSGGTLLDYCASFASGTLAIEEAKFFFRQIVAGLQQLQTIGMCHRSISLETILLEGKHCRLTHYGSALRIPMVENESSTPRLISPRPVGGRFPESVAPELWAEEPFDGYAVDVWSAGIVLWKMVVTKVELFAAPVPDDIRFREYCLDGKMKKRLKPVALPDSLVELLEGLLRVQPGERYTVDDVLGHPWLAEG